jgi:hypothetical protein
VNDSELALDDISGFVRDFTYQRHYQLDHFRIPCRKATARERLEPFSRVRRYLKRRLDRRQRFEERGWITQEGVDFDPRLLRVKPHGIVYLEGYWQSEDYFKDVEDRIRADLQIKPPVDQTNLDLVQKIQNTVAVAVHVRFFSASSQSSSNTPAEYYQRAITMMEKLVPDAHYYVFSDRPDAARACIGLPDSRVTSVSHNRGDENAYADLWLMTQCQHFIIANSSFSWWGAWLAGNVRKSIIAPGFELREGVAWWGFKGLIPQGWIKC